MSKSIPPKQEEQLNTQSNADGTPNKNYSLLNRKPIPGTPFTMINKEDKWFLTMGDYRLTEIYETEDETLEQLASQYWNIILRMCACIVERYTEEQKTNQKTF